MAARKRRKIVISNYVHPDVISYLEQWFVVTHNRRRVPWSRDELLRRCRDASGLMVFMPDCIDEEFLNCCPELEVIAGALKGADNFDLDACRRRNIWFTIARESLSGPTADLAVGLLLCLTRKIRQGDTLVRSGRFTGWRPILYGTGLAGQRAGILGFGSVGRLLADRLTAFDMQVSYWDEREAGSRYTRARSFADLVRGANVLFPLLPLNGSTIHLIDASVIALAPAGAIIVNVGRGSLVDEQAIAAAIASGHLGGYAADVFEFEDWARNDRPKMVPASLRRLRNRTVFTPHLGSAIERVRHDVTMEAARNLVIALQGQSPPGAVFQLNQ